ncbi:NAD(P)H-dependent oxidoreductase [Aliivibrio fischeri]|uniref:NAD(P)H-dependent oxidoreductase n=1 Tax=Aliivibrio fischeri TaxID=668 RepID=UPI0003068AC3|nr:NAD(P)H-dependent oxidoreductase [Aliivibrio fischeri]OCH05867.1 NAD(P)H-dependent oxidoreductase [Aliivibrio fischeri]OCH07693.1 NAD(P)H-dependent oxidoreductase [Aliivibrio fischeri]OEE15819.1 NAD(P)H-dependent oxidoreductase [Aliivibrio fischeri ZF-211]
MTHPIIHDLENRYTSKKYDPSKKVSQEDLAILLEALRLSASSINSQPWKFIVIESDEAKQRMHDSFANMHQFNQPHIKACSHVILFANKLSYTRDDYDAVLSKAVADKRITEEQKEAAFASFKFVELNCDENGEHKAWTKPQAYLALGNALHTLARLNIDSTTMEGIDPELLSEIFSDELKGYECHVALAIGYHHPSEDYNASLPKSRKAFEDVITIL